MADDGRHIDERIGMISGEGAGIAVADPAAAWPIPDSVRPVIDERELRGDTYYDLPVVKMPPWKWYIPTYFAIGGLAGAAATLAGVMEIAGDRRVVRALHGVAVGGEAIGAALLIADLGRPARFHHMLRVFRPTSPMNVGTWILSAASATSGLGWFASGGGRRVPAGISVAGIVSGAMLSTYTGVLVGNTAVPLWHATRRRLPLWFAALSAASVGSVMEVIAPAHPVTRVYAVAGKTAQLAGGLAVAHAAKVAGVDAPLRGGRSGAMWKTAAALGVASLAASLWGRRDRRVAWIAGGLGIASTVLGRFALHAAGRASAADPRATFVPQRAARDIG